MRYVLIIVLALVTAGAVPAARAQDSPAQAVIAAQIDAFKAGDLDRAFTFASPTIKALFGTPENFGTMVRQGYPMVWRPAELRFLGARTQDGALWQDVMIRDAQGRVHVLEYEMIEAAGGWVINAVRLRPPGDGLA